MTNKMSDLRTHQNYQSSTNYLPLGFEKNYPKNIFIPIIEHLSDLGMKQKYEHCVGTRQLYEGKNVVSLSIIHTLLTQKWFLEGVDRSNLLGIVCSKILVNSKIKKKIFHLKVAQVIIGCEISNEKEFRQYVSKQIAFLANQNIPYDQFLSFPNLTLYLFHLMARILCDEINPDPALVQLIEKTLQSKLIDGEESDCESSKSHLSSKQEFRLYLKLIIKIFNTQKLEKGRFGVAYEKLQELLSRRQLQFSEKFDTIQEILNTKSFMSQIAENCFSQKKKGLKVTNTLLNGWIDNFKAECLKSKSKYKKVEQKIVVQDTTDHELKGSNNWIWGHKSRIFHPIIIKAVNQKLEFLASFI